MNKKLDAISALTYVKKYSRIKLKDGRELIGREDCNGWEEDNTPNLLVNVYDNDLVHRYNEILVDEDIETVTEFIPNK